ncbi:unnamed protein product [Polarella glacialis]|uniref:Uncharacterized protein n=1 Tax=Polarella glacialis TaxID=89957 RepID=A0A813DTS2_POLGL|nr:unnamed protein product [Polarella glacialis]
MWDRSQLYGKQQQQQQQLSLSEARPDNYWSNPRRNLPNNNWSLYFFHNRNRCNWNLDLTTNYWSILIHCLTYNNCNFYILFNNNWSTNTRRRRLSWLGVFRQLFRGQSAC